MTQPQDAPVFAARKLGPQLRIPNLFLKRADEAFDVGPWAAEFAALRPA
jgi:hypothetical protein